MAQLEQCNSNLKFKIMKKIKNRGFTIIELAVVICIIAILSAVILFSVTQYINNGKDSNIQGNLAVLIPAGEAYYGANVNKYTDFCDPTQNSGSVLKNAIAQMPVQSSGAPCYSDTTTSTTNPKGVCCFVESTLGQSWAACAKEFSKVDTAFCVDSRGVKEEIDSELCDEAGLTNYLGSKQCPEL
jgi:prepilin-type N-terminal cleavage/methylation domain-containing protein